MFDVYKQVEYVIININVLRYPYALTAAGDSRKRHFDRD